MVLFPLSSKYSILYFFFFWGLPPLAAGPLQGSQVCSALRRFQRLGLPLRGPLSGP